MSALDNHSILFLIVVFSVTIVIVLLLEMRPSTRALKLMRKADRNNADPAKALDLLERAHAIYPRSNHVLLRAGSAAYNANAWERTIALHKKLDARGEATG